MARRSRTSKAEETTSALPGDTPHEHDSYLVRRRYEVLRVNQNYLNEVACVELIFLQIGTILLNGPEKFWTDFQQRQEMKAHRTAKMAYLVLF